MVARRSADVAVRVFADNTSRISLANQSAVAADASRAIGPFPIPAGRVVPLRLEATGVRRILVAPMGTVLASIHPTGDGELAVAVTNFGRTTAQGEARLTLPDGSRCRWTFEALAPGTSTSWPVTLGGPAGRHELRVCLDAGRRSASSPYAVRL
ncbi:MULTISPECIES: hypothetical protein [unclassified Kribbella]|uniref:hypothetical protein n=1 Tax=unclassified Kribbella TaxID=2644121 RepID=UPI00301B64E6